MDAITGKNTRRFPQLIADNCGWLTLVGIIFLAICFFNYKFFRLGGHNVCNADQSFADCQTDMFKYGSLGGEISTGIPYRVFEVLPEVFADAAPESGLKGYRRFGFVYEHGGGVLPLGFATRMMGYERVTLNCALCHMASYRFSAEQDPKLAIGGPATTVDIQAYLDFLREIVEPKYRERWDHDVLAAIEARTLLSWYDRPLYRYMLIPWARSTIARQAERLSWSRRGESSAWGPGRSDSINRVKAEVLGEAGTAASVRWTFRRSGIWESAGVRRSIGVARCARSPGL